MALIHKLIESYINYYNETVLTQNSNLKAYKRAEINQKKTEYKILKHFGLSSRKFNSCIFNFIIENSHTHTRINYSKELAKKVVKYLNNIKKETQYIKVVKCENDIKIFIRKIHWESPTSSSSGWEILNKLSVSTSDSEVAIKVKNILSSKEYFFKCSKCFIEKINGEIYKNNLCRDCEKLQHISKNTKQCNIKKINTKKSNKI